MPNNAAIYNGTLAGIVGGLVTNRFISSQQLATILATASQTIATAVDASIAPGSIDCCKGALIQGIAQGVATNVYPISQAQYNAMAQQVVLLFNAANGGLVACTCSGGGSSSGFAPTTGADLTGAATQTILCTEGAIRILKSGALTGNNELRLGATGVTERNAIEVQREDVGGFTYKVVDDVTGAPLFTFPAGEVRAASFVYVLENSSWGLASQVPGIVNP